MSWGDSVRSFVQKEFDNRIKYGIISGKKVMGTAVGSVGWINELGGKN